MTVPQMFDNISARYDFINAVLSFGIDRYWRKAVCKHLPGKQKIKLLDCATGTGDQLISILKNCPHIYDAVGMDPAREMLALAKPKLAQFSHCSRLITAPAEAIPFPDNMFDAVTISFGIRNVADLNQSLREIYRILAPEGRLIILEFSHPRSAPVRFLHRFYLNRIVPYVGKWLSRHKEAYTYLSKTIETFPQGQAMASILKEVGFENVQIKPLTLGIVSLYIGEKR
ncbi:MAG: bifunctional demethylmenaquinone methyltransferase/2-methoxy-6-polyprenyl-1,4-benzoquinol methylase UbiE [Rhabdochlamydiaceae bacterium]